jgi:hypothetical protein
MNHQLFSIGHSNHPLDRFLGLLAQHRIKALVDIRRFPGSRKFPHLNQENLAASLQEAGIEYHWIEGLGGRRRSRGKLVSEQFYLVHHANSALHSRPSCFSRASSSPWSFSSRQVTKAEKGVGSLFFLDWRRAVGRSWADASTLTLCLRWPRLPWT